MPVRAIFCSWCPLYVGNSFWFSSKACPKQATFPWPKIPNTPGNNGSFLPSINIFEQLNI